MSWGRPSVTVRPSAASLRDKAELSTSLDQRPDSPAAQTSSRSSNCTTLTPVSPPLRRSSMHCMASRASIPYRRRDTPSPHLGSARRSVLSMSGSRQVTGSEEPASMGKFERSAVVTMLCAWWKLKTPVVEIGNGAPFFLEHLDALLEEIVARIQDLAFTIARVVALLDHRQDGVDGELVAAAAQRLRNIAAQTEAKLLRAPRAQIGQGSGIVLRHWSDRQPPILLRPLRWSLPALS